MAVNTFEIKQVGTATQLNENCPHKYSYQQRLVMGNYPWEVPAHTQSCQVVQVDDE